MKRPQFGLLCFLFCSCLCVAASGPVADLTKAQKERDARPWSSSRPSALLHRPGTVVPKTSRTALRLSAGGAAGLKMSALTQGLIQSGLVALGANSIGYLITRLTDTHKITDLVGTGSFVATALATQWRTGVYTPRALLMTGAISFWGTRLASFLFARVLKQGDDARLGAVFKKPGGMEGFWTIQAAWAWICMVPHTLLLYGAKSMAAGSAAMALGPLDAIAATIMIGGIVFESVADWQKWKHRFDPSKKGTFCKTGLWSLCRQPNYFGELCTWWGGYFLALPGLLAGPWGWKAAALGVVSPLWIQFLLLFVSGIPLSEKGNEKKYGQMEEYKQYKKDTPLLIPKISNAFKSSKQS